MITFLSVSQEGYSPPRAVGRGRGVLGSPMFLQFGTPVNGRGIVLGGNEVSPGFPLIGRDVSPPPSHPVGNSHEPQRTSSALPSPEALANEIVNQMGDVIQHVTQKVVQNIITQLSPSVSTPLTNAIASPTNADVSSSNMLDASHVQLVSHRKLKDPPCFRGESSDSVSVREWEDLMQTYIKKSNLRPEEQAEEILVHLRGKAKDIARVGTRNSDIDITRDPYLWSPTKAL